jgi:hypothetical protein
VSVLVIRAHKRFAVRQKARLGRAGKRSLDGLVIELSLDGCRISNLAADAFAAGQAVTLRIDGTSTIAAHVRWLGQDAVGLRFARPLTNAGLDALIRLCRPAPTAAPIAATAAAA